jgi:hypothetical protein
MQRTKVQRTPSGQRGTGAAANNPGCEHARNAGARLPDVAGVWRDAQRFFMPGSSAGSVGGSTNSIFSEVMMP